MWAMLIQSNLKTSEENILHFQAGNFPNKFLNVFAALVFRGSYNVVFPGLGLSGLKHWVVARYPHALAFLEDAINLLLLLLLFLFLVDGCRL